MFGCKQYLLNNLHEFGCIYPDMCIAYNITSSDRSIGHYLQTL